METMKKRSFASLQRPIITCILCERTVEEAIATIKNGEFAGAHAFAIHLEALGSSNLTDENMHRIAEATRHPIMFLHYRGSEKWPCSFTDEERAEVLKRAIKCGASAIDITADMFCASPLEFTNDSDAVARQRRCIDEVHDMGGEVVMSSHIYEPRTCEQVLEHLKAVESRGADFAKIVTMANTEEEFVEAIRTTLALRKEMRIPFIHLCGGKFALPHRYLSPSLGNALTFCVQRYSADFTTVQPPLQNMLGILERYNWHIDACES